MHLLMDGSIKKVEGINVHVTLDEMIRTCFTLTLLPKSIETSIIPTSPSTEITEVEQLKAKKFEKYHLHNTESSTQ